MVAGSMQEVSVHGSHARTSSLAKFKAGRGPPRVLVALRSCSSVVFLRVFQLPRLAVGFVKFLEIALPKW